MLHSISTGSFPGANLEQLIDDLQVFAHVLSRNHTDAWEFLCNLFGTHLTLVHTFARFTLPLKVGDEVAFWSLICISSFSLSGRSPQLGSHGSLLLT